MIRALLLSTALLLPAVAAAQTIQNPPPVAGGLPAQPSNGGSVAGSLGEFVSVLDDASTAACTSTNASPTVIACAGNTFAARCVGAYKCLFAINFTGLVGTSGYANSTPYYIDPASISGATFKIASSVANALAGTDINTTATDAGTGVASSYQFASGTGQAVDAIDLPAGDWDCNGGITELGVTSTQPTTIQTTISIAAIGIAPTPSDGSLSRLIVTVTSGAQSNSLPTGVKRFSLSAATWVYDSINIAWTGGATSPTSTGLLRCRRAG